MKKISLLALIGVFALLAGGCSQKKSEAPEETTQQQPPPSTTSQAQNPEPSRKTASFSGVGGLISPINPDQRRTVIKQGRSDPFALIPVQPEVKVKPSQTKPSAETASSQSPSPPLSQTSARPSNQPSTTQGPHSSQPIPPLVPPSPPEPELAQAVAVTGVIDVGGVPQAIVKAPNETFSRYVRPGQYLSNGQVLVKRIDVYAGSIPVVVFEELGIEVYKQVGEGVNAQPTKQTQVPSTQV